MKMEWFNKYFENNCFIFHKWGKLKITTRKVVNVIHGRPYDGVETYQCRECSKCGKYEYEVIDQLK